MYPSIVEQGKYGLISTTLKGFTCIFIPCLFHAGVIDEVLVEFTTIIRRWVEIDVRSEG